MKTYAVKPSDIHAAWHVIDAAGRPLGRVATEVASLLRGKHKPIFTASMNVGDHVIVINASQVAVTGKKLDSKYYHRHSGYPGGLTSVLLKDMLAKFPERVIEKAVRGMLPKNRVGADQFRNLRVYAGPDHPHAGQILTAAKSQPGAHA